MARKSALGLATSLLVLGTAGPAAAQGYRDVLVEQMNDMEARLVELGYRADPRAHHDDMVAGVLDEGGAVGLEVLLEAGAEYAIVGFCDQDCGDLDLALDTTGGEPLFEDTQPDDYPVLEFVAPQGGRFLVLVRMYECSVEPCGFAYRVFRK